jgi:hypothetical protein
VDGRSNGHPRSHAPEGAAPAPAAVAHGGARRGNAGDDQIEAPGHGFARKPHLSVAGHFASLNGRLHGWNGRRPRRGVHGGGRPAAGRAAAALRLGTSEKEGRGRILTAGRSSGGRELDGDGGGGADQLRRPISTGGDGELRLGCTRAYGFDRMRRLAHTHEGEAIERVQGALPAAEELGRRSMARRRTVHGGGASG